MWCTVPSPILQQGRGRLSFQFHFQHIQLHIHLIVLWPFKLLPLLCDDVRYERQIWWNEKMQAGHKQEQEKKLTDWRQKSLVPSFSFHIWEICEQEMGQDEKQLRMCDNQANGSISCMLEIRMKESSNETWSVSCWRCSFSLRGDACYWCN